MRSISDTISHLRTMAAAEAHPDQRMGPLVVMDDFERNPGGLRGYLHVPHDLPAHAPLVVVLHSAEPYPVFRLDPAAHRYPFAYASDDRALFGPGLLGGDADQDEDQARWLAEFRAAAPDDTLRLLNALNEAVGAAIAYRTRDEEGMQSPPRTLALRSGSCRDLAALFLWAVRRLGFPARAVSGYLFDPGMAAGDVGATHV
ncbi:transglutaminase-like domain-containing protein [Sphingomonas sanguinis]|uniref:transglutaminase-like domain-containing protein n=1 Tax=Sphingomonas sanguinis TaxID=33051 RepID=UPI0007372DF6|nr:transglutaminase family protein [Sphingomonas sanguinis]